MRDAILVLNAGSSSLKFAVVDPVDGRRHLTGLAERLGTPRAELRLGDADSNGRPSSQLAQGDHAGALAAALELLRERGLNARLSAVGHRVVHGGERFHAPTLLDDANVEAIAALSNLAPLHNPVNVLCIRAARAALPEVPHLAVFDTAFHQTLPPRAFRYAVPESWYREHGVRRYGFHGTSHAFVFGELSRRLGRAPEDLHVLSAHLGNGASATAISAGKSRDTTMGLTPLAGLVMGTRSGDIDPAIVPFMAGRLDGGLTAVDDALYHQSGLLGLSGKTNDMRELVAAAEAGDERAALALDVFCYRLAGALLALTVALPRLDAVIFTGGIGEHASAVRARTVARLGHLGLRLDEAHNATHGQSSAGRIDAGSGPGIYVIATDEERRIAHEVARAIATEAA